MQRLCPQDCPHWWCFPFSHLIVVSAPTGKGKVYTAIICAHCRHDVNSAKPHCRCRAECHTEARAGRVYDPEWVAAQVATG